jgi:hypothetical protein
MRERPFELIRLTYERERFKLWLYGGPAGRRPRIVQSTP